MKNLFLKREVLIFPLKKLDKVNEDIASNDTFAINAPPQVRDSGLIIVMNA